jgi:hypothetical protein
MQAFVCVNENIVLGRQPTDTILLAAARRVSRR